MWKKSYRIALRKRNNDFFWEDEDYSFCEFVPKSKRYWLADPFIFEKDNRTYIFFEEYDRTKRKGRISFSEITNDLITEPTKIIDESFHLSFPYVFEYNNEIYMLPETSCANSLILYRAIDFPYSWERRVVLKDIFCCDSILLFDEKEPIGYIVSEMFKNPPNNKVFSCYVKNKFFRCNILDEITSMPITLAEGDYGIRNAGAIFSYKGKMIRPGQDCSEGEYGKGVVFFEIDEIDVYKEHRIRTLSKDEIRDHLYRKNKRPLLGVHTYNISEKYEIIDFSFMENYPLVYDFVFLLNIIKDFIKR